MPVMDIPDRDRKHRLGAKGSFRRNLQAACQNRELIWTLRHEPPAEKAVELGEERIPQVRPQPLHTVPRLDTGDLEAQHQGHLASNDPSFDHGNDKGIQCRKARFRPLALRRKLTLLVVGQPELPSGNPGTTDQQNREWNQ